MAGNDRDALPSRATTNHDQEAERKAERDDQAVQRKGG